MSVIALYILSARGEFTNMKTRYGFVSNSSSCSFVIKKYYLSPWQIEQIKNHATCGIEYADTDHWEITETDDTISGDTIMDNFNLLSYMNTRLGINRKYIEEVDPRLWHGDWDEYERRGT